jgi:hypothetical protein
MPRVAKGPIGKARAETASSLRLFGAKQAIARIP